MQYFKVSDLTVPKTYSLQNVGITQSLLSTWKTCRRKFLFSINRWERIENDRFAYHSMMHYLLEVLYKMGNGKILPIIDEINKYNLPGKLSEIGPLKATAQVMMDNYINHYKKDFVEKRFELVEGKFSIKFGDYILLGKKDGRFRDKQGGRWHIEHKNYSRIDENFLMQHLSFDLQNMFYALADLIEFKKPLKGVLYNIIRKPETRKERSTQELYQHLTKEVSKNPDHYYIRYEIPYSLGDIEEFKAALKYQLDELCGVLVEDFPKETLTRFYKNESACDGKYQCPFLGACSTGSMCGYRQRKLLFPELEG
jgi:PD-(D/E)XK nuclease superfamily